MCAGEGSEVILPVIDSHQEPVSGQACNPPDPHWFFLSFLRWRSFTVLGTKVAPFP